MKRVAVIGVAPGQTALDPDARARIGRADLVVGASRHLALVGETRARLMEVEGKVSETVALVAEDPALDAVFLASGDPGFFGIGALLTSKLGADQVEVVPAVTSLQYAFSRAGIPWSDARWTSLHAKPLDALCPLLGAPRIGLLTDANNTPAAIARFLDDAGWSELTMVVASDLGLETEKFERGVAAGFTSWSGSPLNVVLLTGGALDHPLPPGIPDEEFRHPRGRITKRLVRAAALSLLDLPAAGVLWDVGAGSGSVGIEAALLRPAMTVCAVEKDAEALEDIRANRRRFRAANLVVVPGEAPSALTELPRPDRVFIGGSGGNLASVLDFARERLAPGGLILVSTVLAETLNGALEWARGRGVAASITQLGVSHSRRTGQGTRLAAQDPVTLVALGADKE